MSNILIIAEKPSLAKAIAQELPGSPRHHSAYIDCGTYRVAKLIGHVLENYAPEDYDARFKTWNKEDLPILPDFKLKPINTEAVETVKENLSWADEVWHAGDPDREGQLLVDELLEYLGHSGTTKRLLIADTSPAGVQAALAKVEDNAKYYDLYQAGKCRSHADWLLGINMSRLITLLAQDRGYKGVISVGRVQTALLALIVRRQERIEHFVPQKFWDITLEINATVFTLDTTLSKLKASCLDEDNRLINKSYAENLIAELIPCAGTISKVEAQEKRQAAPL